MASLPEVKNKELHRIVITAIIYKPDRTYLITKRSMKEKAWPGKWTVPGGGLSIDDYIHEPPTHGDNLWYGALEKTLRKEVKEEVNLDIGKPEYLLDITFIRSDGLPAIILSFFAPYITGEIKLQEGESDEYAWITLEQAKQYELIDGILDEITKVDEILKQRE